MSILLLSCYLHTYFHINFTKNCKIMYKRYYKYTRSGGLKKINTAGFEDRVRSDKFGWIRLMNSIREEIVKLRTIRFLKVFICK